MPNHYNRDWRERWQFDTDLGIALHDSGLLVQFEQSKDHPNALDGHIQGDIPESINWRDNPTIIGTLMRQAGDGYAEALENDAP